MVNSPTFRSALWTEVSGSKWWLAGKGLLTIVPMIVAVWAWLSEASATEVFAYTALAGAIVVILLSLHAKSAWNKEHQLRLTADQRYEKRPILVADFGYRWSGRFVSPGDNTQITLKNRGQEDARGIEVRPVVLSNVTISVPPIHAHISPDRSLSVTPQIQSNDPLILETTNDLRQAITDEFIWNGSESEPHRREWGFHLSYEDLHGRRFQTHSVIVCDRRERWIWIEYRESGFVTQTPLDSHTVASVPSQGA